MHILKVFASNIFMFLFVVTDIIRIDRACLMAVKIEEETMLMLETEKENSTSFSGSRDKKKTEIQVRSSVSFYMILRSRALRST